MMPSKKDASSDSRHPYSLSSHAWTLAQRSLSVDDDDEEDEGLAFSNEQAASTQMRVSTGGQAGTSDSNTWAAAQHNWNMTDATYSRRTSGTTSPSTTRNPFAREQESSSYTSARRVSDGPDTTFGGQHGTSGSYQNTNARQARNNPYGAEIDSDHFQSGSQIASSVAHYMPSHDSAFGFQDPHNHRYPPNSAPRRTPSFRISQAAPKPDLLTMYREKMLLNPNPSGASHGTSQHSETASRALGQANSIQQGSQYGYSSAYAGSFSAGALGRNNGESLADNGYPQGPSSSVGHNGACQFGSGDGYRQTLTDLGLFSNRRSQAMQLPMDARGQEPISPNEIDHNQAAPLGAALRIPPLPYTNNYMAGTPNMHRSPTEQVKSQLLRDFLRAASDRSGPAGKRRHETWQLTDIYGHVVEFCLEENGSRFIQDRLPKANSEVRERVFTEVHPNLTGLSKDQYGNFVVQQLIEYGTYHQKTALLKALQGKVDDWARDKYASRVVQKALEKVLVEQQVEILNEMKPILTELCEHPIGNHLVQKALRVIEDRPQLDFIYESVRGRVCQVARHTHGCRILSEMMKHGTDDDKASIMGELSRAYRDICMDPMGNYVIQEALKHALPEDRNKVVDVIISNVVEISKSKSGSHVVELLIKDGTSEERRRIKSHVMACGPDNAPRLQGLCVDQYGNYVIKSLLQNLQQSDEEAFRPLWEQVHPFLQEAKNTCTGKARKAIDSTIKAVLAGDTTTALVLPFRMDPSLVARTPSLTMEPQSPASSAVDEPVNGSPVVGVGKAQPPHKDGFMGPVRIVD